MYALELLIQTRFGCCFHFQFFENIFHNLKLFYVAHTHISLKQLTPKRKLINLR